MTLILFLIVLNFFSLQCPIECALDVNLSGNEGQTGDIKLFDLFRQKYNKKYQPGTTEFLEKYQAFKVTLKRIRRLNHQNDASVMYGITEFADLTPEEFKQQLEERQQRSRQKLISSTTNPGRLKFFDSSALLKLLSDVPKKVDWRERGIISQVRNQGKCGACWAYSTVETIESMAALKTSSDVTPLSVQQVIDCGSGKKTGNQGCDGGDTCSTLKWMKKDQILLHSHSEYPMRNSSGQCRSIESKYGVRVLNYTCNDFSLKEQDMVRLLAFHGPLTVAVDATAWQDYLGGIIQYHCEVDRNHAVQVVGYDLTGKVPFYIVKNTWGREFGLDGFLYIAIGKNLCGIAQEVSSVDVSVLNKN